MAAKEEVWHVRVYCLFLSSSTVSYKVSLVTDQWDDSEYLFLNLPDTRPI